MNTYRCHDYEFQEKDDRGVLMNNGDMPTLRKRMRELSKTS
jgi:hypothetical protein